MSAPGSLATLRRVLANRALRRVLLGYLAFHIAEFATWVAILLYAYAATGPASVGVVALIQLVPAAIAATPAATLGDRYPRERVLTAGYLFQAGAMAATAAAMLASLPVWAVYTMAALAATSLVVTRPTQAALLPSLSDTPDELTAANGAAGVVEGVGVLIGPLIAAAVLTTWTSGVVFAIAAAALLLATLSTLGLRARRGRSIAAADPSASSDAGGIDSSFLAGLRTVIADADARLVVGIMTVRMVIIGAADVLFVLMALDLLGTGEPGAGILSAALGAGTIAGGALTFALAGRAGLSWITVVGAFLWGVSLALVGLTAQAVLAPLLVVVGGAGLTIVDVAGRTMLQRSIRDEVLARVFGLQEGLAMVGLAIGSVLVAAVVGFVDLSGAIVVSAALLPVTVLLAWSRLASLDRRGIVPAQAVALLRGTSLFAPLAPPELEAVARRGTWLTYPGEAVVIREGDPGDRYFVISSGAVRVDQAGRLLRTLDQPGSGFGEIALLRDVPRTATVTTIEPAVLLAIDRGPFLAAVTGHPAAFTVAQETVDRHVGPDGSRED
jgi:predicted MFS family arabinose efflux permease